MSLAFSFRSVACRSSFINFYRAKASHPQSRLSASASLLGRDFSSMTGASEFFTVGVTGSTGLVGTALADQLSKIDGINGKPIRLVKLKRGEKAEMKPLEEQAVTSLVWNPKGSTAEEVIDPSALSEMDAVVHLAGENISTGLSGPLAPLGIRPWTDAKKKEIMDSRTIPTKALANAISNSDKKIDFLVSGGIGAYGLDFIGEGVSAADETADISKVEGFLAEVSRQWEASAEAAEKSGNRVIIMRSGVVLSTKGGAMAKLYPIFLLGGGGNVGSGQQYFSFISGRDMARAIVHMLETATLKGPVNVCAPGACTNAEFTSAMGKVLRRPTILPFPSFAVSLMFGEMGEEILLGGTRATPKKLLESGFQFSHPTVYEAVQSAVDESI